MTDLPRARVVMVGPGDAKGGGIASVIQTLKSSELAAFRDVAWVSTTPSCHGARGRLIAFLEALRAVHAVTSGDARTIVHLHVASRGSFLRKSIVGAAAEWRGAAVVYHIHGGAFDTFLTRLSWLVRQLAIARLRRASCIIVLSERWRAWATELFPGTRVAVVPNPVDVPEEAPMPRPPRVIFAGRLCREKGVFDLIEAMQALHAEGVEAEWVLAGGDPTHEVASALEGLGDTIKVSLPGWLDHDILIKEMMRSRVLCLPSHVEALPMVMLEAMACGVACVVTDVGGVRDVLHHEQNGLLVRPREPAALVRELRRLLLDSGFAERLGMQARNDMFLGYDTHRVVELLDDLYSEISSRPGDER